MHILQGVLREAVYPSMRVLTYVIILALLLVGIGCAVFLSTETRYLSSAKNKATQDEFDGI